MKSFKVSVFDFTQHIMPYNDEVEIKSGILSKFIYLNKEP